MSGLIIVLIWAFFTAVPVILFYFIGRQIENNHFTALAKREQQHRSIIVTNLKKVPEGYTPLEGSLCMGSVVMGSDYFKRFVASIQTIFGGRISILETVMERGRREAIVRMLDQAKMKGADLVINVRVETSMIGDPSGRSQGGAAEIIAYGTAVRQRPS